jgi:hypothetical protein
MYELCCGVNVGVGCLLFGGILKENFPCAVHCDDKKLARELFSVLLINSTSQVTTVEVIVVVPLVGYAL